MAVPVGYRVLIEIPQKDTVTKGGIYLPEALTDKEDIGSDVGIVRKLGALAFQHDKLGNIPWVKEGDKVYYIRYSGHFLKTADGKKYRFINDEDIYGLVEENDKEETNNG